MACLHFSGSFVLRDAGATARVVLGVRRFVGVPGREN